MVTCKCIPALFLFALIASCAYKTANHQPSPKAAADNTLKVLTYNVHACSPPSRKGATDVKAIADVIQAAEPDLVALQEVDRFTNRSGRELDQAQELGRLTGMHSYFVKAIDWSGGEYGIAILSKHALLDTMAVHLPMAEGIAGEARAAAIIKIHVHGKDILFASTHLDIVQEHRELQAEALLTFFSAQKLPVILAGDFNDVPESNTLHHLLGYFKSTCDVSTCEKTFPQIQPKRTIDYIMYHPGDIFTRQNHVVLPEEYASDHRPVLATILLK